MKTLVQKRCSPPGCPRRQVKLQTRRLAEIESMSIQTCMQSAVAIPQRDMENELVKVGLAIPIYQTAGWAWDPSPVLLFEQKPVQSLLYESCMDGPGRYLSTLCVSTRFRENIRDLWQGDVISKPNS